MYSKVSVISFIFSVILGNILCAEVSTRNSQNPWQQLNTSSSNYNTQEKNSEWPALGQRRNQQNNVQSTTKSPQWVLNGSNWVRNTPQGSNTVSQNSNPTSQNSNPTRQNSNSQSQNSYPTRQNSNLPSQSSNPTRQNSNPPLQNSNPTRQNSNPLSQNSNPTKQNSNPSLQNSNPTRQNSNPLSQNANPTSQNSNPSLQNSNPTRPNSNPLPQNSNPTRQTSNPLTQNSKPNQNINYPTQASNRGRPQDNNLFLNNERNSYNANGGNSVLNNNRAVVSNQGASSRPNGGINNLISSGSLLTGSEDSNQVNAGSGSSQDSDVNDEELRQFSEELLNKESNNAAQYVTINLQGMTSSRSTNDEAPLPLLTINQQAYSIPSVSKLLPLYNNYIVEANQNEVYTAQEKNEENDLLTTVLQTPVMQHTRNFLVNKGKIGKDPQEFKELLRLIWFNMYSRGGGRIGSSGFEHVFLAELKNNQVSGLHNWVYFNEEEKKNNANYLGYMKKIDLGNKGAILKFHFTFQGVDKPVGSMFIGTSPELEMALYSTCFVLRADKICPLKMNGNRFIIRTYTYRYRGKNMIGSAFPEI